MPELVAILLKLGGGPCFCGLGHWARPVLMHRICILVSRCVKGQEYFHQLTRGCGQEGCSNSDCATGSGKPLSSIQAAAKVSMGKGRLCTRRKRSDSWSSVRDQKSKGKRDVRRAASFEFSSQPQPEPTASSTKSAQRTSQLEQEKRHDEVVQQLQQQCRQLQQEKSEATQKCSRLEQQLTQEREAVTKVTEDNLQLQQENQHLQEECSRLESQLTQRVQSEDEFQQHLKVLKQRLHAALAVVQQLESFPQVTRDEVEILDKVDTGAWGCVYQGRFQGQVVAIKSPHLSHPNEHTIQRLQREVKIMAEVQHPNILQFIGAVFDDQAPLIVMELLDTNLRKAYQNGQLSDASKLPIFRDVAYALHFLHEQQDPIIHRDVSAPNVLLERLPNGIILAKVSDFGSANLARQAQTMGEGAIMYAAPETLPQAHNPDTPPLPQTTKIDVYSYGILLCEVIVQKEPAPSQYKRMLQQVKRQWLPVHELIILCTKREAVDRLTMAEVLGKLTKISRSNPQPQNLFMHTM